MNLIESIIEELLDTTKSLAGPLLKTKVLANRIENTELYEWADKELIGYRNDNINAPLYRLSRPSFSCTIRQGFNDVYNQPLPLLVIKEDFRNKMIAHELPHGIQALEEQASGKSGDFIGREYSADMIAILNTQITPGANIKILQLSVKVHISEIIQTLSVIRSKLLDFMLKVEAEFPQLEELIKQKIAVNTEDKNKLEQIIHQTFIYARDGNTITTGDRNTLSKE